MAVISVIFERSLMITIFVFTMMLLVDWLNVMSEGALVSAIKGSTWRQYITASFLGATPGCLGAFANVSLYIHGSLSFGAIVGGMIATSGDEAFVMLTLFPGKALGLFALLFLLGTASAWLVDKLVPILKITPCNECGLHRPHNGLELKRLSLSLIWRNLTLITPLRLIFLTLQALFLLGILGGAMGPEVWNWERVTLSLFLSILILIGIVVPEHYLKEHIWRHIIRRHIWRLFLWTFSALLLLEIGFKHWNLEEFVRTNMVWVLLISAVVGIVPGSGPHLVFVMMFAKGIVPFSVLLTSSFIQDGDGMLPLLSYTVRDWLLIKAFNFILGLGAGIALYAMGS
ncbi:MAG TPA: selenocysteine protein [Candidatus Latescibacteria bacterium]|nr:selenocysteine protein [Candidatus Latescibacterota bacterium]